MSKYKDVGQPLPKGKKKGKRREYRAQKISIFFMLWAVFAALSLFIVIVFGVAQNIATIRSYEREARQIFYEECGQMHARILKGLEFDADTPPNETVLTLSRQYDAEILLLDEEGEVLLPIKWSGADEEGEYLEWTKSHVDRLVGEVPEIYGDDGEYVYGCKITLEDREAYLYISKTYALPQALASQLTGKTLLMCIFMCILTFALSGVVSDWFTRPIIHMKEKANALARGDFTVNFHDDEYGQELVELANALNHARDELSKADTMQKELIANVSHDFKTPLTMIKAYASMIMEISGDIKEKRDKHAQVIVDETDRLTSLVSDLLELSKMRSGLTALDEREFDMSEYLQEVMSRFEYFTETKGYVFHTQIEEGLYTRGDQNKLGQALYNLIGNAVNYTGENKRVFVELKKTSETVFRFSVTDTGAGIKEEDLANIWERYYRSSETHKRPVRGTGLGLSIVKTVLEKHRFVFGVTSELGTGSTFYVDFPLLKHNEGSTENALSTLDKA